MKSQSELITRLKNLKPFHISPYNLGDMNEIAQIIDQLQPESANGGKEDVSRQKVFEVIDTVKAQYPASVFPDNGTSPDAQAGMVARLICDNIKREMEIMFNEDAPQCTRNPDTCQVAFCDFSKCLSESPSPVPTFLGVSAEEILYEHWKKWADKIFKDVDTSQQSFNDNFEHSFVLEAMEQYASSREDTIKELRDFVYEVGKGQQGELKGDFIARIINKAKQLLSQQKDI